MRRLIGGSNLHGAIGPGGFIGFLGLVQEAREAIDLS